MSSILKINKLKYRIQYPWPWLRMFGDSMIPLYLKFCFDYDLCFIHFVRASCYDQMNLDSNNNLCFLSWFSFLIIGFGLITNLILTETL